MFKDLIGCCKSLTLVFVKVVSGCRKDFVRVLHTLIGFSNARLDV